MSLEEKWEKDKHPIQPVMNEGLTCRTCRFKHETVIGCDVYEVKPLTVLKGGVCHEYKREK